ncbi:FAD-binding oxidoreductase [Halomonas sp. TRM85114]|uniref:NAD(P)/FAD-dependent oxidoreductase n=1 Tax=Halomonas jincaotanensis TaxID=2810616 RepID=UPI001BD5126C|nr:FAD-dependent oxidoreductase [Halomonas jincaotanensis]MBS9403244.1 FAD-binding oxidoreductase [Halomonas jincaotanensis]
MDLKSGYPFWAVKNGLMQAFPQLCENATCDVAVIGGGITGALIANELAQHGHDVAVIERRDIGWGSSSASTALLQYEIDVHLTDLADIVGLAGAVRAYRACAQAIRDIETLANEVGDVDFGRQQSLYYASEEADVAKLRKEFDLRRHHGFVADWLTRDDIKARFGFDAPGAILTHLAARIDPYRMTYKLFDRLVASRSAVYDRTTIADIQPQAEGVTLTTADGVTLKCRHLVMAAGYESQTWLTQKVAKNRSSYAFITDPIHQDDLGALASTMIWESARPYLYMRTTGDGRLMVGGEDDDVDIPDHRDQRVGKKAHILVKQVETLFPELSLNPTFSWGGTFAETEDGLPFFGPHAQYGPRVHFAMAYGGNGVSYSMVGAGLLRALIEGREHPLAELFSFNRTA